VDGLRHSPLQANCSGTGLGDRYRVPQGRQGHLEGEVDAGPKRRIDPEKTRREASLRRTYDETSMVRRESTVRIRQSLKYLQIGHFCCLFRRDPEMVIEGVSETVICRDFFV
jgi:hypothetical protein